MGYTLYFDRKLKILLARIAPSLTQEVLVDMSAEVRRLVAERGACPAIVDFSGVTDVRLSSEFMVQHGRRPAVLKGQRRVLVAPSDAVYGICRMFGTYQLGTGDTPVIVRTMQEAYGLLGIVEPDFQPLEPP